MKKVIIIHHCGWLGGAGVSILNVAKMLSNNYEVIIYCPSNPPDIYNYFTRNSIKAVTYGDDFGSIRCNKGGPNLLNKFFWTSLYKIIHSYKKIKNIIEFEKPDIIVINTIILCWAGIILKKFSKSTRSIIFIRETANKWCIPFFNFFINRYFDGAFFISQFDYEMHKPKTPISGVIRNSALLSDYSSIEISQISAREKLNLPKDVFLVAFLGGINKLKGSHVILKAMTLLKSKDIHLVIIGYNNSQTDVKVKRNFITKLKALKNQHYERKCNTIINKNALKNKIHFINTQFDISTVLKACDTLVFPSTKPHQARPIFEAGIMHLPVIISDFKETSEYIENLNNGLTFKPLDYKSLARSIILLHNDITLYNELGKNNYQKSLKNHNFDYLKLKVLDYFHSVENLKF
jgi:glycosyltransferase involved in cell wall biosynthesis